MENRPIREQYYNSIQHDVSLVQANTVILVCPRGLGKTTMLAERLRRNIGEMPRSLGAIVTPTYTKLLKDTLPALLHGINKLGYYENVHYVVGRYHKFWPKPYFKPQTSKHIIHFNNGAVAQFVSQDVAGSANGPSYDWMIADELKFIDREKLGSEMFPAMRGNDAYFGHSGLHHGWFGCTDMPMQSDGSWIFEYENEMDPLRIKALRTLQVKYYSLMDRIHTGELSESTRMQYSTRANTLWRTIVELNKGKDSINEDESRPPAVYYLEPKGRDVLANIHNLRPKFYRQMHRELTTLEFEMSIMNERHARIEDGFYPDLDPAVHGYLSSMTPFVSELDFSDVKSHKDVGNDCRSDGDLNPYEPLRISPDYGVNFNCCVVAQMTSTSMRFLNCFYVSHPMKISHLVADIHDYYKYTEDMTVILEYDSTAIAENAISDETYIGEWQRCFEDLGWTVELRYHGRPATYLERYNLWSMVLVGNHDIPRFEYNRDRCGAWATSCELAPIIISHGKLKKDKSSERPGKDQVVATHLSEAGDVLMYNEYKNLIGRQTGSGMTIGLNA